MDLVEAAAIPLVGVTGSQLISVASGLQSGQTVLVSGAAGAVGRCAVCTAKASGARVIAGVQRYQLDQADSIGADETIALDDPAAFATIPQVDIVANMVRGKTATDLLTKVKDGGTFASVTGEPDGAKDFPKVRVVSFVTARCSVRVPRSIPASSRPSDRPRTSRPVRADPDRSFRSRAAGSTFPGVSNLRVSWNLLKPAMCRRAGRAGSESAIRARAA
jgi:NADPH:quinone reductase-like Zn-dependent oxidoreductase